MFQIDDITLIAGAAVLLLTVLSLVLSPYIYKVALQGDDEEHEDEQQPEPEMPGISIILTPHDNAFELERYLPLYLEQEYAGDFQVIVVTSKGESDTEDVLKKYASNKHLYATFIPVSSRYMSRKKLAITVGVKAAKYDWLLIADAESYPATTHWLQSMAESCNTGANVVMGYTCYDEDTPDYRRFIRLYYNRYLIREALHDKTYRYDGSAMMLKKKDFISREGFRNNLKYLRGEYDFLANEYAFENQASLNLTQKGITIEQEPTDKTWRSKQLFYQENRRHLSHSLRHRLPFNLHQWALHIALLAQIGTGLFAGLTSRWILLGIAGAALLIGWIVRSVLASKAIARLNDSISFVKLVPYEISLIWHALGIGIMYKLADKNDFISHKL